MFARSALLPLIGGNNKTPTSRDIRIADKALRNVLEPFPGYPDTKFSTDFNWAHEEPELVTSYQLYLQNLRIVGCLLAAYERTEDSDYLEKAEEIVDSWMEYVEKGGKTDMTWYDHAVGTRSRVLMQFLVNMQEAGRSFDSGRFTEILETHARLLMDDTLHRMNNHGLMMDMALVSLGLGMNRMDYVYRGMGRAESIFWQSYSDTGMHQENSPEYHSMVTRMFGELEGFLSANNLTLGAEFLRKLKQAKQHPSRIVAPNGKTPVIGDSSSPRSGQVKHTWDSFHDAASGFTALKSEECKTYLAFICGFSTVTHKHSDDLSVLLTYEGKDFFVDSGKYNYGRNKYRRYVVSHKAHSIFSPGRTYQRNSDNQYSKVIATDHFMDFRGYSLVSGHNFGYKDARLRRSVYLVPNQSALIVDDQGQSKESENWTQRFVLAPNVDVNINPDGSVVLENNGVQIFLSFEGGVTPKIEVEHGEVGAKHVQAVISNAGGKVEKTKHLVFRHAASREFSAKLVVSLGHPFTGKVTATGAYLYLESDGQEEIQLPAFSL